MSEAINAEAKRTLEDMHNGLHVALETLVNYNDAGRTEAILRQLDTAMVNFLNRAQAIR